MAPQHGQCGEREKEMSETQQPLRESYELTPDNKIIRHIVERKGKLVAISQLPATGDYFLFLVCVEHRPGQYVTWILNCQTGGFSLGHYHESIDKLRNRVEALMDFTDRLHNTCVGMFP
jgi:hypothetical protein